MRRGRSRPFLTPARLAAGGRSCPPGARVPSQRDGQGADAVPPRRRPGAHRRGDHLPQRGAASLAEAGVVGVSWLPCPTLLPQRRRRGRCGNAGRPDWRLSRRCRWSCRLCGCCWYWKPGRAQDAGIRPWLLARDHAVTRPWAGVAEHGGEHPAGAEAVSAWLEAWRGTGTAIRRRSRPGNASGTRRGRQIERTLGGSPDARRMVQRTYGRSYN